MAEGVGFEPTVGLHRQRFSSLTYSVPDSGFSYKFVCLCWLPKPVLYVEYQSVTLRCNQSISNLLAKL